MARKGSRKAFLCLPPAAFSRFPSISFVTHLCLHLALSGFALTLLSEFTLLPFLCSSALLPVPLAFSGLYLPFLHSRSPLRLSVFPPPAFGSVRRTQLGTLWFSEHRDSAEAGSFPGLGGRSWLSGVRAAWLPACSVTAGPGGRANLQNRACQWDLGSPSC